MGIWSSSFKSAMDKAGATAVAALIVQYTDGSKYYAAAWANSDAGLSPFGVPFEGRVLSFAPITYGSTDRNGRLQATETYVTLADSDSDFAMRREGRYGGQIKGTVAKVVALSPDTSSGPSAVLFTGVVRTWEFLENKSYKLVIRTDDAAITGTSPRTFITAVDWPNAKSDALGQLAPVLYGVHDATALGAAGGAVPCLYVDSVGFRYLVQLGYGKSVRRVYSGSTLKTLSSDYTVEYVTINGRLWTVIDFISDQGEAAVTVDVEGCETAGTGGGSTINNPLTQLRYYLANFCYGDYQSGAWSTSPAQLDSTSWLATEAVLDALAVTGSRRISGTSQVKGADLMNDVADKHGLRFYWTTLGTLGVAYAGPRAGTFGGNESSLYISDPWVRQNYGHVISKFTAQDDPMGIVNRISVSHCYLESKPGYVQALEVRDTDTDGEASDTLEMRWSPSSIVG